MSCLCYVYSLKNAEFTNPVCSKKYSPYEKYTVSLRESKMKEKNVKERKWEEGKKIK
jgi:hypothetical protein